MAEEFLFQRGTNGLIPYADEAMAWFAKKKLGSNFLISPKEIRNAAFFKKYFALMNLAYDVWTDHVEPMEYKDQPVEPDFTRFRHDTTILAGFYRPVISLKGETRLEAESISWSRMNEERFEKLYNKTIEVLIRMVYNGRLGPKMTEEELKDLVNQISEF